MAISPMDNPGCTCNNIYNECQLAKQQQQRRQPEKYPYFSIVVLHIGVNSSWVTE